MDTCPTPQLSLPHSNVRFSNKSLNIMGNDNPKPQSQGVSQQQQIMISHQRFERYKHIANSDLLEITIDVPDQKQMKTWQTDVSSSINGFQSKDSLLLPIRHEYQPKGWCGNTGSARIYYENFPYLFSEEIDNRRAIGKYFDEEEIWYLMYNLVSSARDFERIDRKIGDVRPHNIFINESGQIKIGNAFSWPYEKTNFEKTAYEKELTYLSPEEIALLEKGKLENTTNKFTSQSFSIGLTLLETGLLFNAGELYSLQNKGIDIARLRNRLNEWNSLTYSKEGQTVSYSNLLKAIVTALCEADPSKRVKSVEIQALLRPYEKEIMNLQDFQKGIEAKFPPALRNLFPQKEVVRPQEQLYYSQTVHAYPQPNNFQPLSYRVGNAVNPPPAQISYPVANQEVRIPQNYFSGQATSFQPQSGHRQVFSQFASIQPQTIVQPQTFEPNFNKYPIIQSQVRPVYESAQTFTPKIEPITVPTTVANPNTYQQFTSSPSPNDFLKKIDQQLQNSRKYYPS